MQQHVLKSEEINKQKDTSKTTAHVSCKRRLTAAPQKQRRNHRYTTQSRHNECVCVLGGGAHKRGQK